MPSEMASAGPTTQTRPNVLTIPAPVLASQTAEVTPEEDHVRARSFPGRPDQVREARTFAAGLVAGSPVAGDVVLCVSEFAANAVLHSHTHEYGGKFGVRVEVHAPDYTWVEVDDDGGPWLQGLEESLAGHGLDIVAKIASEWGIDGGPSGWIVWARFDWPAS